MGPLDPEAISVFLGLFYIPVSPLWTTIWSTFHANSQYLFAFIP